MKRLTMNQVARASLKANKKAYLSLAVGILLSVYLCSAAVLGAYGTILANRQKIINRVGYIDTYFLNCGDVSDQQFRDSGLFSRIGKVYVTAQIGDTGIYAGYYDEDAMELLPRRVIEGRLPEKANECAVERETAELYGLSVDETVSAARERSPEGAWLTATLGTIKAGIFQDNAARSGYSFVVPDEETRNEVQEVINTVKAGRYEEAGALMRAVCLKLWSVRDIPVVAACTEIPIAYGYTGLPAEKCISSLEALADACIRELYD